MSLWGCVLGILGEPCLRIIEAHYLPLLEHGERSRRELAQLSEEAVRGRCLNPSSCASSPQPLSLRARGHNAAFLAVGRKRVNMGSLESEAVTA
ncbi:MAG: hypothetical protein R3E89_14475 [Thiolinea sp.]